MTDNIDTKVVLKQRVLYGSNQPEVLQRVATVYVQGKEYRVSAPPEAKGDALNWVRHFTVLQLIDLNSEVEIHGEVGGTVLRAVKMELERQKRDSNRAEGMNPDGLHFDAQICLNGHVLHCGGTPFDPKAHCTKCGAPCIDECPRCGEPIRGVPFHTTIAHYSRPQFYHKCGQPYPWMEDRLRTAHELLANDVELSPDDRDKFWPIYIS
jgi:Uncharacterized protein conserved in bacteria (DUF2321)